MQWLILSVALSALSVNAQQSIWGQCGGTGWTGATTCVSGSVCTYQNAYYSQCLPSSSSSSTTLKTTSSSSTSKSSTSSSSSSSSTSSKSTTSVSTPSASASTEYFITFGDSYSQTGFDVTSTQPSASNPLGNPAFPGWTTDNGPNWIGYLISQYNDSLVLSYNFAYGGATVDSSLVAPYASTVLSLVDQVTQFSNSIASHPSTAPWTSSNSLFGIWIGVNDVGNSWYNDNATETTLLGEIFDQYFAQVQILYTAGARNFVFLGVPPINRTPALIAQGTAAQEGIAATIAVWNTDLQARVANFTATHSGVSAVVVDTQPAFNTLLDAGGAASLCYNSDGVTCLWYNDYHPGQKIQNAVAQAVASAEPTFF